MNMEPMNFDKLYELRHEFVIVGLAGRTGAGCTKTAGILSRSFTENSFPDPEDVSIHNNQRKYKIVHKFGKENYKPFTVLRYQDFITSFVLEHTLEELKSFLQKCGDDEEFDQVRMKGDFAREILEVELLKEEFTIMGGLTSTFNSASKEPKTTEQFDVFRRKQYSAAYDLFFNADFVSFSSKLHDALSIVSKATRKKLVSVMCNNLRRTGCIYGDMPTALENVYKVAERINIAIKAHREHNRKSEAICPTRIVIDSFRNPLEIMFFKERYSAFLMFAIHIEEDGKKIEKMSSQYGRVDAELISTLDEGEYEAKRGEFFSQDVHECIQKSDVHIRHFTPIALEDNASDEDKFYWASLYSTEQQLLLYVCLFMQPGLVTPSPQERCMQVAFTAKYNSGCISRQVGAVVTNEAFSIKAVGWNNTPEGHVPCLLRSADDLEMDKINDKDAFSDYERKDPAFRAHFLAKYAERSKTQLKGHSCPFCFKSYHNSLKEGKNQVHTRSLHAEENAFLQVAKDGGQSIEKGMLFTSASPCELCAKKAYQLGIRTVYYIDPYPGISKSHILGHGKRKVSMKLFNGAIGRAYHKLYEPFMAYKDELNMRMGLEIKDKTAQLNDEIKMLKTEIAEMKKAKN